MEQFPTNNPENTNQEVTDSGEERPLSFSEHMEQKQNYEQAFKEAQDNGTLPEGVRDAQDYQEYLEANQAHKAEQINIDEKMAERDKTLLGEIASIEEPKDKNLATVYLVSTFTNDGTKFMDNDGRLGLEFILDYAKRKDKDTTIADSLNKIEPSSRYAYIPMERIKMIDEWADEYDKIQQKIHNKDSDLPVKDFCSEKSIGGYRFKHYMDEIDNEDSAFSLGEKDFVERPKQDKGILLYMAEKRTQRLQNDNLNKEEYRLAEIELARISEFYAGKSFGNQFREHDYFMSIMEKTIHEGKETVDIRNGIMDFYAIHKVAEEFDGVKNLYKSFQKYLAEGQAILDNFKNNQQ